MNLKMLGELWSSVFIYREKRKMLHYFPIRESTSWIRILYMSATRGHCTALNKQNPYSRCSKKKISMYTNHMLTLFSEKTYRCRISLSLVHAHNEWFYTKLFRLIVSCISRINLLLCISIKGVNNCFDPLQSDLVQIPTTQIYKTNSNEIFILLYFIMVYHI